MKAVAATGSPIQPSSTNLRQVCSPPPRKVSGAQPTSSPRSAAAASTLRPSSRVTASGFSLYTCLPASSTSRLTWACTEGMVRLTTISISGSASRASGVRARIPNSAARASAAAADRSAQATTSMLWKVAHAVRYCVLMFPQPIRPTLTFSSMPQPFLNQIAVAALHRRHHVGVAAVQFYDQPLGVCGRSPPGCSESLATPRPRRPSRRPGSLAHP